MYAKQGAFVRMLRSVKVISVVISIVIVVVDNFGQMSMADDLPSTSICKQVLCEWCTFSDFLLVKLMISTTNQCLTVVAILA